MSSIKKRVLICDDDEGILDVAKIVLEEKNYEVFPLTNGNDFQKAIKTFKPHVILTDLRMPQLSGVEITKLLKNNPRTKNIPIIIISAHDDGQKISDEIGADGYLRKPFDIKDLESIVGNLFKV